MIKYLNLIKHANENSLLKRMNSRIKEKQKNIDYNKKRYWKLSASERLHYDSRAEKIYKDNLPDVFYMTFIFAKMYLLILVIFTSFKVLFQVDPVHLVNAFLAILGTAPKVIGISVVLDILFVFYGVVRKNKQMKFLNKKYGFKKV